MARGFMSFMRGVDIMRAIGWVGLKVEPVLGPEIARATASAIWAQNRRVSPQYPRLLRMRGAKEDVDKERCTRACIVLIFTGH